ncbi:zinc finger protein 821 isoform X8 [Pongo abelii]|uniref:zinc finger protein 821 isoform X8 n=1 Tax=Pongo abelii TaxID=9601 RepID=UPI0030064644
MSEAGGGGPGALERGRAPLGRPGLGAPRSPSSPEPLSSGPAHSAGRAPGRGERDLAGAGEGEREARARASLAAGARAARSRRPRRHLFPPPSVCLLLALSVCSAAPRLPATGSARSPFRSPGPSPGAPRPGWLGLRSRVHCPAVRLSGGGAQGPRAQRSAEAPDTDHLDSVEFALLRGNCTRAGDMLEDCLKAASFATSCGGLSLPFAVSFFFWDVMPLLPLGKITS